MSTETTSFFESLRDDLLALPKATILDLFRSLRGDGTVGFDHERSKKSECIDKLVAEFPLEKIDAAMRALPSVPATTAKAPTTQSKGLTKGTDPAAMAQQFAQMFAMMSSGSGLDEERVQEIVDSAIADAIKRLVNRIEVSVPNLPPVDVGVQHKHFELLLKSCNARLPDGHRLNVWLAGPAGSGKTTAAKMVAKALNQQFIFNGAISTPYELTGFMDANGRYVKTPFREAWENGGVYLFDEVDSSNPNAVTAFNAALANGCFAFPDGMVDRHPDCIVIAGANTSGNGATNEYVGRMKQDGAFLNRFVEIDWPIDERLEEALTPNKEWVNRVQAVRQRVKDRGIKGHMVTPRASLYGSALLAAGVSMKDVERMTLKKGLADDAWNQIK